MHDVSRQQRGQCLLDHLPSCKCKLSLYCSSAVVSLIYFNIWKTTLLRRWFRAKHFLLCKCFFINVKPVSLMWRFLGDPDRGRHGSAGIAEAKFMVSRWIPPVPFVHISSLSAVVISTWSPLQPQLPEACNMLSWILAYGWQNYGFILSLYRLVISKAQVCPLWCVVFNLEFFKKQFFGCGNW